MEDFCPNCESQFNDTDAVYHDEYGPYRVCGVCGGSSDV